MFEIGRLTRLALGYESEGNSRPIEICVADWLADWPGATIGMLLMRPGEDTYYPAAIKVLDGVLHFTPSRADMAIPGDGLAQIVLTDENDVELRSRVVRTMIECSLPGSEAEAPEEPMRPFVDQVLEAAASAVESAASAGKAAGNAAADAGRAEAAADNAEAAAKRAEEAAGMIGPGGGGTGTGTVTSVNGVQPDEAGNVEIDIPEPPKKLSELEGDAEHRLVTDTEKAAWDAKSTFSGKYADLSGKPTIPTKLSEMAADATHRLVTDTEKSTWNAKSTFSGKYADLTGKPTIPNVPSWALQSTKPTYTAAEVGALPSTYKPPTQTAQQVGADPAGTAASKVSTHNADEDAHPAIRKLISDLSGRLSALADSDDTTLDQLSEIVAYIKSNKSLIDSITTGKVSTADIVNSLTSTATNKPLSAAQGKALKALIDAIVVPTKTSQLTNDSGYLTEYQDISHLLPRTELGAAVDVALAEAKASGAFDGEDGEDGMTPVKGVDYYTEADKAEFSEYIASELAKRGQLKPEFAQNEDWLNANGDTSLLYVLPDGMIWANVQTVTEGETVPNFTNVMDDPNATIKTGTRYSQSGAASGAQWKTETSDTSIIIPIPSGSPVIRVRGAGNDAKYNNYIYISYDGKDIFPGTPNYTRTVADNGDITITVTATLANPKYATFAVKNGFNADELIVTVNEEITYTTTEGGVAYKWASTGHAFVPADYEDRIIAVERKAASNTTRIAALENKPDAGGDVVMYISPTGDDANNGLSTSAPKKTVKACVEAGATRISAKRGVYAEAINLLNIGSLEIFPTDNDKTYVTGETRQPIVFDTSDSIEVSALTAYNSIKRVAYSATNAAYDAVFVQQTLAPTVSASQSSYHAAIWLFSDDERTVCRKPKPVLTIAECEEEANTFCFSGGYIYVNADMNGVTKIIVPTITTSGFYVNGADKLVLNDVEVRFSGEYTYDLRECAWVDLYKCSSKFTTRASGFHPVDTNGIFRACYATKCFDGFAPNGHGHTTYIDCVSEYNYDDGMSHHAASEGTVIGGRYEGNGKGGNIPAYGAKVNIYGGLYKNNKQFGICYAGDGNGNFACGMVQGAVMVDNPVGLEVQVECMVTAMGCKYAGNAKDKVATGTLTEY